MKVDALQLKMNRMKIFHIASQNNLEQRAIQAETALTNRLELSSRFLAASKPILTDARYKILENAVEDILINAP